MIHIIESEEALEALRAIWEDLEQRVAATPFQRFLWARAAWRYELTTRAARPRLFIIVAGESQACVRIILPTFLTARGTLRFLLDDYADHNDALSDGHYPLGTLCSEVAHLLATHRAIRAVDFRRVPATSGLLGALALGLRGCTLMHYGGYGELRLATLPEATADADRAQSRTTWRQFPHLRAVERKKLNRLLQRSEGMTFTLLRASEAPFPEAAIAALRTQMITAGVRRKTFLSPALLAVTRELYEAGQCEVGLLTREDAPLALGFHFRSPGRITAWILLVAAHDLPSLYNACHLARCTEAPGTWIDFGTGAYDYKFLLWRPIPRVSLRLVWKRGLWGRMWGGGAVLWRLTKDALRDGLEGKL